MQKYTTKQQSFGQYAYEECCKTGRSCNAGSPDLFAIAVKTWSAERKDTGCMVYPDEKENYGDKAGKAMEGVFISQVCLFW